MCLFPFQYWPCRVVSVSAVISHRIVGPNKKRFGSDGADTWKELMQFADGPKAFEFGAGELKRKYMPREDGSGGDLDRLWFAKKLGERPDWAHFKRPERYATL